MDCTYFKVQYLSQKNSKKPKTIFVEPINKHQKYGHQTISIEPCNGKISIEVTTDSYDYDDAYAAIEWHCSRGHDIQGPIDNTDLDKLNTILNNYIDLLFRDADKKNDIMLV